MLSFGSWQGMDAVQTRLDALRQFQGFDSEFEAEGDEIVREAQIYPPEKPNQRYVRTFDLQGAWRRGDAARRGRTIEMVVANAMEYASDVMGDNQDQEFRGRWRKLRTIAEDRRGAIRSRAQAWALKVWRGG